MLIKNKTKPAKNSHKQKQNQNQKGVLVNTSFAQMLVFQMDLKLSR